MPMTWAEIEQDAGFRALSQDERSVVQREWFNKIVAPQLPEKEREPLRESFFVQYPHGNQDPAYGQDTLEGVANATARGFETGFAQLGSGVGALVDMAGGGNDLLQSGRQMEQSIREANPVSRQNEKKFVVQAGDALGQAGSMVVTNALIPGPPTALRIGAISAMAGTSQGEASAVEFNVTDPLAKAAMVLGYGAAEAIPELGFGSVAERGALSAIRAFRKGETAAFKPGLVFGAVTEGLEEPITGVGQRSLDLAFAKQNPETPGFTYEGVPVIPPWNVGAALNEFALGTVAGGGMHAVQSVFNAMTPQEQLDTKNLAGEPEQVRKAAWALQRAIDLRAKRVAKVSETTDLVDPATASVMRVVDDMDRAQILDNAKKQTAENFAPGWQQREKQPLQHSGEDTDTFFDQGEWKVQTGLNEKGQPVFSPAPNAAELEKARQDFIQTGDLPEGMQPIVPKTAPSVAPKPASVTPDELPATLPPPPPIERPTRHRVFEGGSPMAVKPGEGVLDARDPGKAYRITDQPQVDDIKASGEVRAKEGQMRGGRTGETQWTRGHENHGYRAAGNEGRYVIVAPATDLNDKQGGLPVSDVEKVYKSDGKQWVDVTDEVKPAGVTENAQPAAPVDTSAADRAFYGDYKYGEMQRVRQQYPNSPELVTGIESANGDAAAKAFLETAEPKAQLREELEAMTPMAIEDKMRSEGVPELQITRAKAGGVLDVTSAFNSILRQRANRPAGEGAPVEPTKPKVERKRRLITREITGDILDVIEEHGGLMSATQAQEQMGPEWWQQNHSLYDDVPRLSSPLHNFIYQGGKLTPDRMAGILVDDRLRPPGYDVNDFWREVGDASKSRHSQHRARAAQARTQATEQKQAAEFHEATASGERAVTSWDIQPGDVLDIEGEKTAVLGVVIEFNPDTHRARIETKDGERTVAIDNAEPGDIILEDGARFGRQRLEQGKAIWVEKIERASEAIDEGEGFGREPLNLLPPEALAAGVLFAPEPTTATPSKRRQPDEFESRLRLYIDENELPEWTDADIRRAVTYHETRDLDEISDLLEPDTVKDIIDAVEILMRTPKEKLTNQPGPAPVAPITQTEIEERGDENPFSDTLWQEAQAIQNPKKNAPPELRRNIGLGAHGQRAVEFQNFTDAEAFSFNAQMKKMTSPKTSESQRQELAASAAGKFDNLRRAYPGLTDAQLRGAAIDYGKQVVAAARLAEEGETFRAPRFNPNNADLPDVSINGIVFAKTVDAHTNIPELVDGAPFAITAGGQAVIVTDHVRVTLDDRRAAADRDTTAAHEALQRVMAQARKALAERHAQDARKLDKRTRYSETAHKKAVTVGVSAGDVTSAKKGLTGILPHVDLAWSGTRAQIETTLRGDPEFQSEWKDDWQSAHPEATRLQANEAFNDFLEFGLDGREGFTFRGRTYLINDQIAVTEADGSAAGAVRRVLIHEDAHEALDYLRQLDPNVDGTWRAFRNGIPAAELDDLATRLYPGLKDWRIDSTMHDDLAHEWWAAKIATIEERGQPEPEGIVGKFLSWLRGVFKTLMGSQTDPDNAALLDFMDAARAARFQAREDAGARGVRYSASNPDGDIPPGAIASEIKDTPPPDGATIEPFKRPRYNLWSPTRQKAYAAFNSNPDLPEYMRHFTQFLGNETDDERITQSLQPMVEMSNRRLGSVHGEHPDVTEENTALAYADAKAMATRRTFARKYIEEFQTWHSPRDADGRPLHAGDAAVAVHQLNLIQYSIRLLAKTGDAKLWMQMQPFANDVILGDFATMSQAARLLNVRSVFSRNAAAMPTALQLTHGAQHEAAATQVPTGREGLDTLAKSISGAEVKDEIKETFDDFIESSDGQVITAAAESAVTDPTFEVEGYRERAVQLLDEQARAWDQQLDDTLRRLDELEQIRRAIEARKAGNIARPSMSDAQRFAAEIEKFEKDPTGLQKQIDAQKERAKRQLGKLTQQDTSHESKEKRRKRVRDHKHAAKVLTADEEGKKLLKRYEDRNKRTRRDTPAWKQTFADQVKTPKSEEDFTAAIQKHGLEPETAAKLFALAEQLKGEREQAKKDRAAKQQTPEAADRRLERMGEQAAKEPTAKAKGPKRLTAASLISSIAAQILRTPLQQQQMKIVTQTGPDGDPEVDDQGGHAAPWNRDWVAQAFSNAFVEHGSPRAEADVMAEKLAGKFDAIMKNAQAKAAIKAARALNVQKPTIQKIAAAIRSAAIDPLNPNPVVKGLAEAAGFGGLTIQDFQRLAQLDAEITNALPTDVAKGSTEVQRILAKVKPPKAFARVMEQLFINGALSSLGVMQLNWFHPTYILPRLLITDLAGVLGDAVAGKGKASRVETMKLAGYAFQSLWRARHGMLSDAIFSLKNDAYSNRMLEELSIEHSLYRELMENWEKLTSGSVAERAVALPKVMWLSSDWVRRMLSSADQMWGGVIQNYVLENEAMRELVQNAGMTTEGAALLVKQAYRNGGDAEAARYAETNNKAEAKLIGRDVMRQSLIQGVNAKLPGAGDRALKSASKTSEMELGNRRGEDSPWFDLPNVALEGIKSMSSAVRNKFDKLGLPFGRAVTGFVSVASNILNRSIYLTPLGLARVAAKKSGMKTRAGGEIYAETMATDGMMRARFYESIVSSFMMGLLALLRLKWDDEDQWFAVTGNGPENAGMREAWLKQGHKPGFLEFRDGNGNVMVGIPYTRGGFDHAALALTTIGALDDMELDGHRMRKADFNWGWAYGEKVLGNQMKQAQFFAIRAWTGSVPSSDKPHALSGQAGYLINPWTPWGGLTKSLFKLYSGAQEQGSVTSAFLSNVPVAQVLTGTVVGPRLNFLGDQIGGQPQDVLKKMAERSSYAGFPLYIALDPDSPNEDIYNFIVEKGIAPSTPNRSELESKNGYMDDQRWADYVTARGDLIKTALRRRMMAIEKLSSKDAQREMERISSEATRAAKRKLNLQ